MRPTNHYVSIRNMILVGFWLLAIFDITMFGYFYFHKHTNRWKVCFLFLIMKKQRKICQIYDITIDVNYLGGVIWLLNRIVGQLELLV